DEVLAIYREANAPINAINIGGDEVPVGAWEVSPACLALIENNAAIKSTMGLRYYFLDRINQMLASKEISLYERQGIALKKTGLDGMAQFTANPDFGGQSVHVVVSNNGVASEDSGNPLANAGYKVILSCASHLYFDMTCYKSVEEPGGHNGAYVDVDQSSDVTQHHYLTNTNENTIGTHTTD